MLPSVSAPQGLPSGRPPLRLLDAALSAVALLLLAILLPILAVAIKLDSPGQVFFRQARLGRLGRVFQVRKFRTMRTNAPDMFNPDGSRYVGKADPRITRTGRFLRLGLDELPQVLNVLRGEMSFIGPRPDDAFAAQHYEGIEWLKLAALPGLTGLAQVTGRNDLPWHDRIKYDIYYHYRRNWLLDLKIVWRTVAMLVRINITSPLVSEAELTQFLADPQLAEDAALLRRQIEAAA